MSHPGQPSSPYQRRGDGTVISSAWVIMGVLCGIGIAYLGIRDSQVVDILSGIGLILVVAALSRPSRRWIARRWAARRPAPDTDAPVVIYWRSNDLRSARLRSQLRDVRDDAIWISTWSSAAAEDTVRAVNGGDEVLPTVMINGVPHTAPRAEEVREAILAAREGRSR